MADRDQKTFPALPQKRERAREQGQVARSRDLASAISFIAGTLFFAGATVFASSFVVGAFREALSATGSNDLPGAIGQAFEWPLFVAIGAMFALAAAAVVGSMAQGGFVLAGAKLAPDLGRLNPLKYLQRIFSAAGFVEIAKAAVKITLIGFIAWNTAKWGLELTSKAHDIAEGLAALAAVSRRILYWSAAIALVAASADYAHKRHEHEAELRMTRQEFLEQLKQDEGNPQIKRAIRKTAAKEFQAHSRYPSGCNRDGNTH